MRKNAQVLWIEDDPRTEQRAVQLEEDTGMSVEFICLSGTYLEKELSKISKVYNKPNLIIIDHFLNDTRSEEWARLGSSLTGFFRSTVLRNGLLFSKDPKTRANG